ncbi:hypothetical protein COOONC_03195 [Cooperia oncophora]
MSVSFAALFFVYAVNTRHRDVFLSSINTNDLRLGIADVTSISLCCLFRIKSEIGGLSPRFEVLIRVAGIIACSSFAAYMVGNMLIAVNRYSALRLKDRYEEVTLFFVYAVNTRHRDVFLSSINTNDLRLGIADVTSISLCCLFRIKSEIGGLSPRFEVLIRIAGIIACSSFAAYMVGNMLIAVNRYSALRLKDRYEEVWSRRNVWIIIGLQYGCAFAAFTPLFEAEHIFLQNADGTYGCG